MDHNLFTRHEMNMIKACINETDPANQGHMYEQPLNLTSYHNAYLSFHIPKPGKTYMKLNAVSLFIFLESDIDPVMMYKLYRLKLHEDLEYLFQWPNNSINLHYTADKWYNHHRVGRDPLEHYS